MFRVVSVVVRRIALLCLIAAIWAPSAVARPDALDRRIEQRLVQSQAVGLTLAIARADGSIVERAYGKRDVDTGLPVTQGMLFRNGSASKMWVAAALLRAMDQRKLSVHQPIGSFVQGLDPGIGRLTVHQLLSHTSGLADFANDFGPHDETQLAARMRGNKDLRFFTAPGAVLSYANPGYDLAGFVLEEVTGQPFHVAIETMMKQIGADRTFYQPTVAMTYPFALGHYRNEAGALAVVRPMPDNSTEWPSGLAYTNARDTARFALLLLRGGKSEDGTQLLAASAVEQMATSVMTWADSATGAGYGYGLFPRNDNGRPVWEHGGSITGFSALTTLLPAEKLAIATIANGLDMKLLDDVRDMVLDHFGSKRLGTDSRGGRPLTAEEVARLKPVPAALAASLEGSWGQSEPAMTIRREGAHLVYRSGPAANRLMAAGGNRMAIVSPEGRFMGYLGMVREGDRVLYIHRGSRALARLPNPAEKTE